MLVVPKAMIAAQSVFLVDVVKPWRKIYKGKNITHDKVTEVLRKQTRYKWKVVLFIILLK